jgi:UDP-N-acetylmuramyl pentapeptide phosphotransferase/UDP-N-acetylglucosamine-1-phosphate transferase
MYIYFSNIQVVDLRSDLLNTILLNNYVNIIFLTFCFLILINGSNFIDGLNGLNLGYFFIVFSILWFLNFNSQIDYDQNKIILFILPIIFLFILNFFNYLYLGDSGAYLLGFLASIFLVDIHFQNSHISPYFIALLLWYPAFENFFSILRKTFGKFNPVLPDTLHLHQLIFRFFKQEKFKYNKYSNQISAVIILMYNLFIFLISLKYLNQTFFLIFLILINIFVYIVIYYLLKKKIS